MTFPNEDMFYVEYLIFFIVPTLYSIYEVKPSSEYGPAFIVQGISSRTKNEKSKPFLNVDNNNCSTGYLFNRRKTKRKYMYLIKRPL